MNLHRRTRLRHLLTSAAAVGLLAGLGCGDGTDTAAQGGAGATSSSSGTGAQGGSGGGLVIDCDPPCGAAQYCSVTQTCIDLGTCAAEGDCDPGLTCDPATNECVPGGGCGAEEIAVEYVAPNLGIVLDRSCSMRRDLNNVINIAGPNKWTYSVDAITQMTTSFADKIRFGLILFPDTTGGNCTQDDPAVPVGPGNEQTIQTLLSNALDTTDVNYPDGPCVTNIDTAMEQSSQEPAFLDPDRASYALLITDGQQAGCSAAGGDAGTTQIITDMHTAGVPTFVVGFGGGVDPAQLDIFAQAGGMPSGGSNDYYQANDAQELQQALDAIATATLGCTLVLASAPENPDDIYVFFNNDTTPIARDTTHTDGWDYDANSNQITFYGPTCDLLKSGQVTDVDVVFGCSEPTPD